MEKVFNWGDYVRVIKSAPQKYEPGQMGAICGFWEISNPKVAAEFDEPIGTAMCTIELGNGETIEVPISLLLNFEIS